MTIPNLTRRDMAEQLVKKEIRLPALTTDETAKLLSSLPKEKLEDMMQSVFGNYKPLLCEGCHRIVKSWYDHKEDCSRS